MKTCRICLVEHAPDIHEATLSLRAWFGARVREYLGVPEPVEAPEPAKVRKREWGQTKEEANAE